MVGVKGLNKRVSGVFYLLLQNVIFKTINQWPPHLDLDAKTCILLYLTVCAGSHEVYLNIVIKPHVDRWEVRVAIQSRYENVGFQCLQPRYEPLPHEQIDSQKLRLCAHSHIGEAIWLQEWDCVPPISRIERKVVVLSTNSSMCASCSVLQKALSRNKHKVTVALEGNWMETGRGDRIVP